MAVFSEEPINDFMKTKDRHLTSFSNGTEFVRNCTCVYLIMSRLLLRELHVVLYEGGNTFRITGPSWSESTFDPWTTFTIAPVGLVWNFDFFS